ncbi:MAG: alpha/beta hydrolase [Spirulinaceae cyanobacterium]
MAEQFQKGDQTGWYHDPGFWGGYFHTYENLNLDGKPRQVHVFLPRNYEVTLEAFPVIYCNDGDTIFFPGGAYGKTWNLATILTRLYLTNAIRRSIVVAIAPLNRDYEYTHARIWDSEWGGLDQYAAYVANTLKGFIDQHYRTLSNGSSNIVSGAGHGGLAAFYTAGKYPYAFGNVMAFSPSFWVGLDSALDPGAFNLFGSGGLSLEASSLILEAENALSQQRLKIYLDWGLVRDGGQHNEFTEERATARGREMRNLLLHRFGYRDRVNLFTVEDPNGQHNEQSWAGRMEDALKLFL